MTEAYEKALDRYEGYPDFYYKKELKVRYKGMGVVVTAAVKLGKEVVESYSQFEQLPTIVNTAAQLITTLINALTELLPTLIPVAIEAVTTIAMGLIDNLPKILDAALELVTAFAQGVIESLPVLIEALPEIIDSIVDFLIESLPTIVKTGVTLFTALIDELPNIITTISNPIRWVQPSRLYLSLLSLYGNSRNIPLF